MSWVEKSEDGSSWESDRNYEADLVIIGSGAGGGIAAYLCSQLGLKIIIVEEGPLKTSKDFRMQESDAYSFLYQEAGGRQNLEKSIAIYQGRCVGGSTTVNWTTSFRTPDVILQYWNKHFGIEGLSSNDLSFWFSSVENWLNIAPWATAANANNSLLALGAQKLGLKYGIIARNVRGCADLGYCGLGCPINAKQSMLVAAIPKAVENGATLLTKVRAEKFIAKNGRVEYLSVVGLNKLGTEKGKYSATIRARYFILAAGAIGSPGLLLRSGKVFDPYQTVGKRTFLHPVCISAAVFEEPVNPFRGAPQSVYCDAFMTAPEDEQIGFKLETPPVHPVLMATTLPGYGKNFLATIQKLPFTQVTIALLRDGFHSESNGGEVVLRSDGSAALDYKMTSYLWDGVKKAFHAMAEIQFAAGAKAVFPVHDEGRLFDSLSETKQAIDSYAYESLKVKLASAHVMGGCAMGADPRSSVVDSLCKHHHLENLWVFDGSVLPTSLGVNPQLTIYGLVSKQTAAFASHLGLKAVSFGLSAS